MNALIGKLRIESGDATIEFIGVFLGLMVPLIYFVMAFFQIQAGMFAAESGAAQATRILTDHPDIGLERAELAMNLAAMDQGLGSNRAHLTLKCDSAACPEAGSRGIIETRVDVPLPLLSKILPASIPAAVTLRATHPIQWGAHGA